MRAHFCHLIFQLLVVCFDQCLFKHFSPVANFGYQSLVFFIYFFDLENVVEILSDSLYSIEAVVAGEKKFQEQHFSNPWI